jgi:acid phosphatase family membrane protein YuiD
MGVDVAMIAMAVGPMFVLAGTVAGMVAIDAAAARRHNSRRARILRNLRRPI